jgi:16S rRNA (guanine527-N7)-methyltransferase
MNLDVNFYSALTELCLKGGNINEEIKPYKHVVDVTEISTMFDEEWFKQKYLIYLPL